MHQIEKSAVPRWANVGGSELPTAVNSACPFCSAAVTFTPMDQTYDRARNLYVAHSRCPACDGRPTFIITMTPESSGAAKTDGVFIHPAPKMRRREMLGLGALPPEIQRAYRPVLDAYNARIWTAVAVCARRTLESVTHSNLPEQERARPLMQQLEALPKHVDLVKPLTTLAHSLRTVGNMGAHFDPDREPDETTATLMVDFLEYLLEYIYALPGRLDALNQRVKESSKTTQGA